MGTCQDVLGTVDQLLIGNCIMDEVRIHKRNVPDQIGTLSQVGTNARSFNLAQKVLTWSSRCNFTFHVLFFVLYMYSVRIYSQGGTSK